MYCRKCGIKIENNSTFCSECGEKMPVADKNLSVTKQKNISSDNVTNSTPFREEFYQHIRSFMFFLTVISASVYYTTNVLNSIRHCSSSNIFISLISVIYGLIALGLIVPSMWIIYFDRSPHSSFVPIKLYSFINILKAFLFVSFGILTIIGAMMGKEEISRNILYIADQNNSVYILTLISQTVKNPSALLVSTSIVLTSTYLIVYITYHISMIRFLNSVSKRINDNSTNITGMSVIGSLSFFVCTVNLLYAVSMYLFLKDDIYNVLYALFGSIFHLMFFLNLRKFGKLFIYEENQDEEISECTNDKE